MLTRGCFGFGPSFSFFLSFFNISSLHLNTFRIRIWKGSTPSRHCSKSCQFTLINSQDFVSSIQQKVFKLHSVSPPCHVYLPQHMKYVSVVCVSRPLYLKLVWRTPSPHAATWHQEQQAGSRGHFLYPTTSLSPADPHPLHPPSRKKESRHQTSS